MIKSLKYRVHRIAKHLFPSAGNISGSPRARKAVEARLGRQLKDGTKDDASRGEWIFREPK